MGEIIDEGIKSDKPYRILANCQVGLWAKRPILKNMGFILQFLFYLLENDYYCQLEGQAIGRIQKCNLNYVLHLQNSFNIEKKFELFSEMMPFIKKDRYSKISANN